jgi:hypothetical protein
MRTLPVFFGVLELLLRAGVTTVAETAFQDKVARRAARGRFFRPADNLAGAGRVYEGVRAGSHGG